MGYDPREKESKPARQSRTPDQPTDKHKWYLSHERRVFVTALAGGLPGALVALVLLWSGGYTPKVEWTLTALIVGCWLGCASALRGRVVLPLQTLSNLRAALREGDFSIRARGAGRDDALGDVLLEVNALGEILQKQRLGALE